MKGEGKEGEMGLIKGKEKRGLNEKENRNNSHKRAERVIMGGFHAFVYCQQSGIGRVLGKKVGGYWRVTKRALGSGNNCRWSKRPTLRNFV